ncbi:PepSY domain-containing protein [Nguyenibacter sp. L1]|uniref:PepSY-associated TM helix domain-containing protein n=1 Tax=Nguyenibacter sp. L1 TaxID=3049350 RepID=UPI002B4A9AC5|nr:PepSY domain-containing protein [Nguyenibacter sp. L1]WRH87262.1 PepSY domain-containing protein [Nguyenibacter sp. L1]
MIRLFRAGPWPDYRTVWRWHFYAGLLCLPFVAFLCLTGTLYLFKPQIEARIDRAYDHLPPPPPGMLAATPGAAVAAALRAVPQGRFLAYELPSSPHAALRVLVGRGGDAVRVYLDPVTLAVLKRVSEESRFERVVFNLHGQLLMGNAGSVIMELVASWTIVLAVTGLYLWWPRRGAGQGWGGVVYPRLGAGGRTAWRDAHAVTGLFVSLFLVLFLASGLPWSFVWGHALKAAEDRLAPILPVPGPSVPDWQIGHVPARVEIAGGASGMAAMPGMEMDGPTRAAVPAAGFDPAALDRVAAAAMRLDLPAPVLVTPPAGVGQGWGVRSDTQNRPRRASARFAADGRMLSFTPFAAKGPVDRIVAYGVAAHEGQLFGWPNQMANLLVATGLLTMSVAATILWLRRRPPGRLGAHPRHPEGRVGWGGVLLALVLCLLLPELAASVAILLAAMAVGRRFRLG